MAGVVPPEVLREDEIVLLLVKPSLWFILLTSARFILVTTGVAYLLAARSDWLLGGYVSVQTIATVALLLVMGRLVWALLVWTSHIYLLTNQRIVTIKGVINVSMFQASLRKMQRTVLYRPLLERMLGLGTLGFSTAATETFDSVWVMIPRPLQTHQAVVNAIHRMQ